MRSLPTTLTLSLPLLSCVLGSNLIRQTGDLHIVNKRISPDGYERSVVLAGKTADKATFPGPTIIGYRGDTFRINVTNSLTDPSMDLSTTIHWHGIHQRHSICADGVAWITQCPIVPNESFIYEFKVPDQAGTYWYHSHHRAQFCDGLRGVLVVYDRHGEDPLRELYDVDDESTIITIADWYHDLSPGLIGFAGPKLPNSTLINGMGRRSEDVSTTLNSFFVSLTCGYLHFQPTSPFSIVNVVYGKRYRFRLVSIACDRAYMFSIDEHPLTIIEADGHATAPHTVNTLTLYTGQRYSVVLHANQGKEGSYWIRASPNDGPVGFKNNINSAVLKYVEEGHSSSESGELLKEPTTTNATNIQPGSVALQESDLHYLSPSSQVLGESYVGGADFVLNLTLGFIPPNTFLINGHPMVFPTTPVLLQILSGTKDPHELVPKENIYVLPKGKVIEINMFGNNSIGGPHPMHLHGHSFDVIKSNDHSEHNFWNPVRRDVVPVGGMNMTSIRFVTDNSGPWLLHCHNQFHLIRGLGAVFVVDSAGTEAANPVPVKWDELCPVWNSTLPSIRGQS
ncbi:laccase 1 BVT [Marasmius fiardii PR-910]|nr:laccase 1 BVT [Marasmius fiardii PR-910]